MAANEIVIIVLIYCTIAAFLHFVYVSWFIDKCGEHKYMISPATLHTMTKMNWIGCAIYWVLGLALAPLFTIIGIFAWLFTVGRE